MRHLCQMKIYVFWSSTQMSPFLEILPCLSHPKSACFSWAPTALQLHVTHYWVQHTACCVYVPASLTCEQIEGDPCPISTALSPMLAQGLLQRRVPSNVYWLNEWNYWPCINGPFYTLRILCLFFPLYLFSAWCSSPYTYFWNVRDACSYSVSHGKKGKLSFITDLLYSSMNFIILVSTVSFGEFRIQIPENANSTGLNNKRN